MNNSKVKIYTIAPSVLFFYLALLVPAFGISLWGEWGQTSIERLLIVFGIGVCFVFVMWSSNVVIINGGTITELNYIFFSKIREIKDVKSITIEEEKSIYGKNKYIVLKFENHNQISYHLGTKSDMQDFVERLRVIVSDKIDPTVYEYVKKPYQ